MGAKAYRYLALYDPEPGVVVEVGADRGEGSTQWLYEWAKGHGLDFASADIDPDQKVEGPAGTKVRNVTGTQLLSRIRRNVSVAYLDGFDWIPDGEEEKNWIREQRSRYESFGVELNNDACQREHLEEAHLVSRKAAKRCVVVLDDTWHDGDWWTGKGGKAVPFLEIEGFEVVVQDEPGDESLGGVVMFRG